MKSSILFILLFVFNVSIAQQIEKLTDGKFMYCLTLEKLAAPHYRTFANEPPSNSTKKKTPRLGFTVGTVKSITIYPINDTTKKQVIIPDKNESAWPWTDANKEEKFILEDMNFDGNNDFRFLSSSDNFIYCCYVYQPSTGQFVKDTVLNKLVGAQFDQNQKLIYENWQGLTNKGTETFKYIDGKLTLIEEEETRDDISKKTTTVTLKKLVDGKMKVVSQVVSPHEN